jgi:hypothetical protein
VLALIGPAWLGSKEEYGQRRIDKADDWVRNELLQALAQNTPIIPSANLRGNSEHQSEIAAMYSARS